MIGADGRAEAMGENTMLRWRKFLSAGVASLLMIAVAAGNIHNLALGADGIVWGWGANDSYQLGDTTRRDALLARQITGLPATAAIAAVALTCTSCGSSPSSRKKPRSWAMKRSMDAMLRLE